MEEKPAHFLADCSHSGFPYHFAGHHLFLAILFIDLSATCLSLTFTHERRHLGIALTALLGGQVFGTSTLLLLD